VVYLSSSQANTWIADYLQFRHGNLFPYTIHFIFQLLFFICHYTFWATHNAVK